MNLKGRLHLKVFKDGKLIDEWEDYNMIVLSGKQLITYLMAGEPGNWRITKVGVGENITPPTTLDNSLLNGVIVPVDGYTLLDQDAVQWNFTIDVNTANGLDIGEFGLFSNDTEQMFARKVRNPVIPKDDSVSFIGDWTVWFVECKSSTFASYAIIDMAFNAPEILYFSAWRIEPTIVHSISSNINVERQFGFQPNIQWDTESAMYLPFSVSADVTFGLSSDIDYTTIRDFATAPFIVSNIGGGVKEFVRLQLLDRVYEVEDLGAKTPAQTFVNDFVTVPVGGGDNRILAGTSNDGQIWSSDDNGVTWTLEKDLSDEVDSQTAVMMFAYDDINDYIYACTQGDAEVWRSDDSGDTWTRQSTANGSTSNLYSIVYCYDGVDDCIIIGTGNAKIMKSTDDGATFTEKEDLTADGASTILSLCWDSVNEVVVAGTDNGLLMVSDDLGETWVEKKDLSAETPAQDEMEVLIALPSGRILVGTDPDAQIWSSDDGGDTWTLEQDLGNESLPQVSVLSFTYDSVNDIVYLGTANRAQLWSSDDDGSTWALEEDILTESGSENRISALGFEANSERKILGTFAGAEIWIKGK